MVMGLEDLKKANKDPRAYARSKLSTGQAKKSKKKSAVRKRYRFKGVNKK
jgi:hypothetical protein